MINSKKAIGIMNPGDNLDSSELLKESTKYVSVIDELLIKYMKWET